jgi:hypothetical protein
MARKVGRLFFFDFLNSKSSKINTDTINLL